MKEARIRWIKSYGNRAYRMELTYKVNAQPGVFDSYWVTSSNLPASLEWNGEEWLIHIEDLYFNESVNLGYTDIKKPPLEWVELTWRLRHGY